MIVSPKVHLPYCITDFFGWVTVGTSHSQMWVELTLVLVYVGLQENLVVPTLCVPSTKRVSTDLRTEDQDTGEGTLLIRSFLHVRINQYNVVPLSEILYS